MDLNISVAVKMNRPFRSALATLVGFVRSLVVAGRVVKHTVIFRMAIPGADPVITQEVYIHIDRREGPDSSFGVPI